MTIFLDIAKHFLITDIKSIRDNSLSADKGAVNKMLGWMGAGRDTDLSNAKRELADELWPKIRDLSDKEDDTATCNELQLFIKVCKDSAARRSKEKSYPDEGTFGPAMQAVIDLTEGLFEVLQRHKLVNISHDDDPLNILRYYAALYFAQKEYDVRKLSTLGRVLQNPLISGAKDLEQEKETLIVKTLRECEDDLGTLDLGHSQYKQNRKKSVLRFIEQLLRDNKELCKSHGIKQDIPVSISFFASVDVGLPALRPGNGFLKECMTEALNEVKKEMNKIAEDNLAVSEEKTSGLEEDFWGGEEENKKKEIKELKDKTILRPSNGVSSNSSKKKKGVTENLHTEELPSSPYKR